MRLQEAAMGVSGQGEKSLFPKTPKNDNDNEIRKIIDKSVKYDNPRISFRCAGPVLS